MLALPATAPPSCPASQVASLLLDHNLSPRLAALLARSGHTVATARDVHLDAATDAEILQFASRTALTIVTADADFAGLHATSTVRHAGIVLIPQPRRQQAAHIVTEIVELLASGHPLPGELFRFIPETGWTAG